MKAILLSAALLLCGISPSLAGETVTVRNNPGGDTSEFDTQARTWAKTNTKVRIAGECASACTMFLMSVYRLDVCVLPGSTLAFHMPYYQIAQAGGWIVYKTKQSVRDSKRDWSNEWLGKFTPKLNAVLSNATKKGLIPNPSAEEHPGTTFFTIKATDFFKTCD